MSDFADKAAEEIEACIFGSAATTAASIGMRADIAAIIRRCAVEKPELPRVSINGEVVLEGEAARAFIDDIDREWTPEEKAAKEAHLAECVGVYRETRKRMLRAAEEQRKGRRR